MAVKVIIPLYPVLPEDDEADRRARRSLGRNRKLDHQVIHDMTDIIKAADDLGFWGVTEIDQLRRYDLDIHKNFYSHFFTGSHFD